MRSASVWRLPWTPVTGSWLKNMADVMGHAPVGSDPLSGVFAFLLFPIAFGTGVLVDGLDFSDDKMLVGRTFSYSDRSGRAHV